MTEDLAPYAARAARPGRARGGTYNRSRPSRVTPDNAPRIQ
ncbi:hypothetical protein [Streptomyces sp. Da 82-17]